ncbi:MAG: hypothetical protein K9J37_20910 [Saprospiraceae bacterium]|nr:hypothetical protein [Saprospiraceae bacterium]MCF8252381.1 hypothetical protein [Saprospiraceae bacterium]MCF8282251.1 hypothetical protein [Bacteroidales bacterium]MCF8313995.1 hypothetical protein [Saprospiraceae bacterium]MCF8442711.1 hypothetical protein [Saprospiraceae bacterium]
MKNNEDLRDELKNSPFLKEMKERPSDGFQVPKNYFQHLPNEVMQKVKEPTFAPVQQPSWLERIEQFMQSLIQPRYALALASVVVLVVAGVVFLKDKNATTTLPAMAEVQLADISDEELFAYVSDNISDFNRQQMLEASGPELPEVKVQQKTPTLPKIKAQKPEMKEIEAYLNDAIDDIDLEDLEAMF